MFTKVKTWFYEKTKEFMEACDKSNYMHAKV